jgi:hypothetical protein
MVNVLVHPNLAAAATAHLSRGAAARFLVTTFNSGFAHVFLDAYFIGIFCRAGPHGVWPLAKPERLGAGCFDTRINPERRNEPAFTNSNPPATKSPSNPPPDRQRHRTRFR